MFAVLQCLFLFIAFLIALLFLWEVRFNFIRRKWPPGPSGSPFIGNLKELELGSLLEKFKELRKKFGNIFTITVLHKPIIIVNGCEDLKYLLNKEGEATSTDRPPYLTEYNPDLLGIVSSSGALWKEHRSFGLKTFKELGLGKKNIYDQIELEASVLINDILKMDGKPFDMRECIHASVANIICYLTLGKRFEHSDENLLFILDMIHQGLSDSNRFILIFLPIAAWLPGDLFRVKKRVANVIKTRKFFTDAIREHKADLDENVKQDYIDAFLIQQKQRGSNKGNTFTDEQLIITMGEFFNAGTESVTSTLRWGLAYLVHYPEVQMKMQQEIDDVIGKSRMPMMTDKETLPYCEAVITEVLRIRPAAPFGGPRLISKDIQYKGCTLPKGAILFNNLYSISEDEKSFPNPETFDPTRFLDDNGKLCRQSDILPFATGPRICLGETLARIELFIFLVSLVQRFTFLPEDDHTMPSLKGNLGLTLSPKPYKVRAVPR